MWGTLYGRYNVHRFIDCCSLFMDWGHKPRLLNGIQALRLGLRAKVGHLTLISVSGVACC